MSLTHWSKSAKDNTERKKGTWSANYDDKLELHWNNNAYHRTVPWDPKTTIGIIRSPPGAKSFMTMVTLREELDPVRFPRPVCFNMNVVSDDEDEEEDKADEVSTHSNHPLGEMTMPGNATDLASLTPADTIVPHMIDFQDTEVDFDPANNRRRSEQGLSPSAEMLRTHHKLAHLSFAQIRLMAAHGHLPKRFLSCQIPKCASCLYGKASKRPWRNKPTTNQTAKT
jgi:hypothetical protein